MRHIALQNTECCVGFFYKLCNGSRSNNFTITDNMDLICAIATPSAQAAYNAAMEKRIPVVYTAVTNPVEAELATDDKMPVGAVTGTSDQLPVEAQLKMIREILPDAKTIGILYTTSEANSVYSISQYEELADQYGFEVPAGEYIHLQM